MVFLCRQILVKYNLKDVTPPVETTSETDSTITLYSTVVYPVLEAVDVDTWLDVASDSGAEVKRLSKGKVTIGCAIVFFLFCLCLCFSVVSGRLRVAPAFGSALRILICSLLLSLAGAAVSLLVGNKAGVDTSLFSQVPVNKNILVLCLVCAVILINTIVYLIKRKMSADRVSSNAIRKSAQASGEIRYSFKYLYGALLIVLLLATALFFIGKQNGLLALPIAAACLSLVLWKLLKWRGFLLIGALTILLQMLIITHLLASALAVGSLWIILPLTLLLTGILLPLCDLYSRPDKIL